MERNAPMANQGALLGNGTIFQGGGDVSRTQTNEPPLGTTQVLV